MTDITIKIRAGEYGSLVRELAEEIDLLRAELAAKDAEIASLRAEVAGKDAEIARLNFKIADLRDEVAMFCGYEDAKEMDAATKGGW